MNAPLNVGAALFWPEERWRGLQARRLIEHMRLAKKSNLYAGITWPTDEAIQWTGKEGFPGAAGQAALEKILQSLPFTTKDQLAAAAGTIFPPNVTEWVCTSGTMGKPVDVPLTAADLDRLAENEATALSIAGVSRGDLVIVAVGMERMFVAGLAYWLGAQKLGAACVRVGPRIAEQKDMLRQLCGRLALWGKFDGKGEQNVFVIGVPSYLVSVDLPERHLAGIIAIGEPVKREANGNVEYNALGGKLHDRFGCPVMSTYAMTETCTTFAEGPLCEGGHLNPELALVEVIDAAGRPVESGETGEIIITPLGVEGMPLLRFKTGDMAALHIGRCTCGRTTPRLGPIVGRRQQLLKIRGVSVYPGAILEAVRGIPQVIDCAIVAEEAEALSDRVTIYLHTAEPVAQSDLESRLRALLRVVPEIQSVSAAELQALQHPAGARKVTRFIDRRKKLDY